MTENIQAIIPILYGTFLILCGIISVIFIGIKAKTALISGGTSGLLNISSGLLVYNSFTWGAYCSIFLTTALIIVFSWRSTKTLFRLMEMIQEHHKDWKGKAIAFLIISLMAVTSVFTLMILLAGMMA